jgi:hypothetical protein
MTDYEIVLSNKNMSDEWRWEVLRLSSISDTESVIAHGICSTSTEALGRAKAWLADLYNLGKRGEVKQDEPGSGYYKCARCLSQWET